MGSLDDLFIDIAKFLGGLRPQSISKEEWSRWRAEKEAPIAIMIPAWKESNVLEAMVKTNLSRLKYRNYRWHIGVYPNDAETLQVARRLESAYPDLVRVTVTDRPGPTSKAHCLKCIQRDIDSDPNWIPQFLAIHDAEDVLHPASFTAINVAGKGYDFIQIPIFSLPVSVGKWVAGTYLDEFAEIHLKEIPVRQKLGMPIPSAGVGTFFSRRILAVLEERFGYTFDEGNLAEDYEISQRIARIHGKQLFLLIKDENGQIVATREYFPDTFGRSVRQKTRWTTGIGLQTLQKWGRYGRHLESGSWLKDIGARYALYRDRKALWANPAIALAWILSVTILVFSDRFWARLDSQQIFFLKTLLSVNVAFFIFRVTQRARFTASVYGFAHGLMAMLRVFVSNAINALATLGAMKSYWGTSNQGSGRTIAWAKTDHRFPDLNDLKKIEDRPRRMLGPARDQVERKQRQKGGKK